LKNKSIDKEHAWKENGLTFTEIIRQGYSGNNCVISGGFVKGKNKPRVDTLYLRLEKDGVEPTQILLRPDEMQIIAWIASGVVWSHLMNKKAPD
jgi:hypothetical protein